MKKTIKLLMVLFIIMLIPNILKAAEVSIENITLVDHSDLLSEKTPASANGLNVNFDVSFTNLDDFAKYKVVINNPTNTEYEVQQETDFTSSDHIVYTYSYEGDSKILKANSKLVMYITLTYKYEVQPNELTDGKFVEKNKLTVNLSNGTENPKTADASTIVLFALVLMFIGSVGLYKYTHRKEFLGTLVALAVLIPVYAYAAEKLKLNVETQITVEEKHNVFYYAYELVKTSEKSKYTIYQKASDGLLDSDSGLMLMAIPTTEDDCYPTINNEYEVCNVVVKTEAYAPGETVNLLNEITLHGIDYNGNFIDSTLIFDNANHNDVYMPIMYSKAYWDRSNKRLIWQYYGYCNNNETLLNLTQSSIVDSNWEENSEYNEIDIKSPATFTMPSRDVTFFTDNRDYRLD